MKLPAALDIALDTIPEEADMALPPEACWASS